MPLSARYFFWVNVFFTGFLALFVLYRMTRSEAVADQGDLIPVSTASPYATVVSAAEEWSDETRFEASSSYDTTVGIEDESD